MSKVAVVYWSGTGNTENMANLLAENITADQVDVLELCDTNADDVAAYDKVALGCPAMGDEVLEEGEFQPFYDEIKELLGDKPVALFGSYEWADGEWMQNWQADAKEAGLNLVADGVICYESPEEDEDVENLVKLGQALSD